MMSNQILISDFRFQFLYADSYMTREEFREMFDMEH